MSSSCMCPDPCDTSAGTHALTVHDPEREQDEQHPGSDPSVRAVRCDPVEVALKLPVVLLGLLGERDRWSGFRGLCGGRKHGSVRVCVRMRRRVRVLRLRAKGSRGTSRRSCGRSEGRWGRHGG